MAYVIFQSRQNNLELWHDFLFDQEDSEETLTAFHLWDTVVLTREITEQEYLSLSQKLINGVRSRRKAETPGSSQGFEVDIEFTITKHRHQILPDWMNEGRGYRLSNTTVYLQAASDEGEDLFATLQSINASKLDIST